MTKIEVTYFKESGKFSHKYTVLSDEVETYDNQNIIKIAKEECIEHYDMVITASNEEKQTINTFLYKK